MTNREMMFTLCSQEQKYNTFNFKNEEIEVLGKDPQLVVA